MNFFRTFDAVLNGLSNPTLEDGFNTRIFFLFTFCTSAVFVSAKCAQKLRVLHLRNEICCATLRPSANQASLQLVHKVTDLVYHVTLTSPPVCRLRDSHSKFHLTNIHRNALGVRVAQQMSLRQCKTRNFCAHFAQTNTAQVHKGNKKKILVLKPSSRVAFKSPFKTALNVRKKFKTGQCL